jgi:hypothetical protein
MKKDFLLMLKVSADTAIILAKAQFYCPVHINLNEASNLMQGPNSIRIVQEIELFMKETRLVLEATSKAALTVCAECSGINLDFSPDEIPTV